MNLFSTQTYSFDLPSELIASEPLAKRDDSRLLVVHRNSHTIEHRLISELPEILKNSAGKTPFALVANNTKVFRARLFGNRVGSGGKVEFFLLRPLSPENSGKKLIWTGLMKVGAKVHPGFQFQVQDVTGEVLAREETSAGVVYTVKFSDDPVARELGEVPLPPYIVAQRLLKEKNAEAVLVEPKVKPDVKSDVKSSEEKELIAYNTIFAKEEGSVAAPTAGRHFTRALIQSLRDAGATWNEITLHVGLGTFKPVKATDVRDHKMHAELAMVPASVAEELNAARAQGSKILAVGTTSTRTLESFGRDSHRLESGTKEVDLFIYPESGHEWHWVDAMLTNFHLPESTLLMMVASFIGDTSWLLEIYQEAIAQGYRFYSYGDAMLIL
jgi:S-adenosylmethionine:tRNA ribosyltransferase-isomerase